jgi:hypothetical protein
MNGVTVPAARPGNGEVKSWRLLVAGVALESIGVVWPLLLGDWNIPTRAFVIVIGLVAALAGVVTLPAASTFTAACAIGVLAHRALDPAWDSARLLVAVLSIVAGAGAILCLLPVRFRRLVASLVIVAHFGTVLIAVFTASPAPWLSSFLWTHVSRQYSEFMYLGNAYHFYSPEPGAATQFWAYLKYDDGSGQWFKMPRREMHALSQEYIRRLSMTESISQQVVPSVYEIQQRGSRRLEAGKKAGIPVHPVFSEALQMNLPSSYSLRMLESYARFLARNYPHPTDPAHQLTGIKLYRVVHRILGAPEIAANVDPWDPTLYNAFYLGEYDAQGRLTDADSPFLYWLIPILKAEDGTIEDYVTRHAEMKSL